MSVTDIFIGSKEDISQQRYEDKEPSYPPQLPTFPEDHEGSDADDDYKEEPRALPKFKKKQRGDAEEDHAEAARRRKAKKSHVRHEEVEAEKTQAESL